MNIAIIGGVAAGAKAAAKIKRLLPNAVVKIFTDDTHVSYSSCGLPYYIQGNFVDYEALLVRSPEEFKLSGIDVFLESKVTEILPDAKKIVISGNYNNKVEKYDRLIIATGATPYIPENLNNLANYANVFTVRKIEDGINIRNKLKSCKNAVIIGGGYIGLEILEGLARNAIFTHVIEHNQRIMKYFDAEMSQLAQDRLTSISEGNFEFHTNDEITDYTAENNEVISVKIRSGETIKTDIIIIASGVRPNISLAQNAGIVIGTTGSIKVDKLMRTNIEDIYACGDCAEKTHIVSGQNVWIPLGSTANKEGRCAAINAAGGYCEFEGVLGSTVTRCLNTTLAMTGLSENSALSAGFTPITATVKKYDKVAYMPDASEITIKVIADKITGLLLGAQAIGPVGADKRVNTITSALIGHLTVEEFSRNDLTYSPPYSTTIDPLLNAMQILCTKTTRHC